jgi:alpha-mannosidase
MQKIVLAALTWVSVCVPLHADTEELTNRLEQIRPELVRQFSLPIKHWRFYQPAVTGAEQTDFDDRAWQEVSPEFSWQGSDSNAMFRAQITIPATIAGQPVEGAAVRLQLRMTNRCELYVDGQLRDAFRANLAGRYTLTEHARPGQAFTVALRANGQSNNRFQFARLYCDVLPDFDRYVDDLMFLDLLLKHVSADQQAIVEQALAASESCIQFTNVTADNLSAVRSQLALARAALAPVAAITKKYDVYYVGHAHIDMNWQWTWPETIDVCHRTWNSAMNLMDEFPDFRFVQSQPGAYVPIEEKYPDEFRRMQAKNAAHQWDPVGGLWNESDTDIPSGEGLARSFLLGQRYYKAKFGSYAVTGWLPDSFGHSRQLPQIMQLSGIRNFYHMRCGNGMEFTWWQGPDGSRVLKANTPSYDTRPTLDQLVVPMENETRFGLPQSLVIFGVGDHGGGPTREQILHIMSYQQDPIFPRVHFISADDFFDQLARQPEAKSLPVVDTDLQYVFPGCYTTHADAKKAIREGENSLYSAEVLSSLAAMAGRPYPAAEFNEAWKPVAFAQFHDIAAGSAIHSTYDWMKEEMAPGFKFAREQTDKSLDALAGSVDTRGPGDEAIVVWNTLSFQRDDLVAAALPNAARYHSVIDRQGRRFPAQADGEALVFVARAVPGFGHAVYFPQTAAGAPDGVALREDSGGYELETPALEMKIDKTTGAMARFYSKPAKWNVIGAANDGNSFELMGDTGNAWNMRYTGTNRVLTTEGAHVSRLADGPVFARVRVSHAFGKSSYTQDVTVYGALPRVDVPTTVDWQEDSELLKIRLPINASHLEASAQIPSGSMVRPVNGQECPGQKWMDVSETTPGPVRDGLPLDMSPLFNSNCERDFDGHGGAFPAGRLPNAGIHKLGPNEVPFKLSGNSTNTPDNAVAAGQQLPLPEGVSGHTLYLLAACANGSHWTDMGFRLADGSVVSAAFPLNEWKSDNYPDNSAGLVISIRRSPAGRKAVSPTLWIVKVPLPRKASELILPRDPRVHLFAATIATEPVSASPYGLSVLNDSKYGFDVTNDVFRLTALRSSAKPDPRPDQGTQTFTYSLYPHAGDWRSAHTDEQALGLNIPLLATVTTAHPPTGQTPGLSIVNAGGNGDLVVSALKHAEDGEGYILRFYEATGEDTLARVNFDWPVRAEETDILERPVADQRLNVQGSSVSVPVGHNEIVTIRVKRVE